MLLTWEIFVLLRVDLAWLGRSTTNVQEAIASPRNKLLAKFWGKLLEMKLVCLFMDFYIV